MTDEIYATCADVNCPQLQIDHNASVKIQVGVNFKELLFCTLSKGSETDDGAAVYVYDLSPSHHKLLPEHCLSVMCQLQDTAHRSYQKLIFL